MKDASGRWVPLALAGAIASLSFAAIFFRLASPSHPLIVAATRLAIAALVLSFAVVRAMRARRLSSVVVSRALIGGVLYAIHFGTWVTSLTMTSVASSVTLVTATPLVLALISFATGRDHPTRRHWISIGLGAIGLSLIGWADLSLSNEALIGDALAFGGALAMAFYFLVARSLGPELDVLAYSGLTTAFGSASLFAFAMMTGVPIAIASDEAILWIALAALVPQLIGHNLLTWALRHATPTAVGISTVGEPVGATLLAWLWLEERLTPIVAAGCAITLSAVLLSVVRVGVLPDADRSRAV